MAPAGDHLALVPHGQSAWDSRQDEAIPVAARGVRQPSRTAWRKSPFGDVTRVRLAGLPRQDDLVNDLPKNPSCPESPLRGSSESLGIRLPKNTRLPFSKRTVSGRECDPGLTRKRNSDKPPRWRAIGTHMSGCCGMRIASGLPILVNRRAGSSPLSGAPFSRSRNPRVPASVGRGRRAKQFRGLLV
jgi:hypothetical protein